MQGAPSLMCRVSQVSNLEDTVAVAGNFIDASNMQRMVRKIEGDLQHRDKTFEAPAVAAHVVAPTAAAVTSGLWLCAGCPGTDQGAGPGGWPRSHRPAAAAPPMGSVQGRRGLIDLRSRQHSDACHRRYTTGAPRGGMACSAPVGGYV